MRPLYHNYSQHLKMCLCGLVLLALPLGTIWSQCANNNVQFSSSSAPTTVGSEVTLTSCIYGGEYRPVSSMVAGNTYRFFTCGDTDFDTQITVYRDSDGAFIAFNDDFCSVQSQVEFSPPTDGTYRILVNKFNCTDEQSCMTLKTVLVSGGLAPDNDDCADAESIECGDSVTGSTATATLDGPVSACNGFSVAEDVWYTIEGTGNEITASLCGSNYDTKIDIFTGSCEDLTCFADNDDFCSLQSQVSWNSTNGTTYYIRVHGFGGGQGAYSLSITCIDPCDPDLDDPTVSCQSATVTLGGDGTYALSPADFMASGSDACGSVTFSVSPAVVTCNNLGTVSATVTATDASGNTANCTKSLTVQAGGALPPGWDEAQVGGASGTASYPSCGAPQFFLTATGASYPNNDRREFVSKTLCGSSELTVNVQNVSNPGRAGIEFRASTASGAVRVSLETYLSPFVFRETRTSTNGFVQSQQLFRNGHSWLRIVRNGSLFIGYTRSDNSGWTQAFVANIPAMPLCVEAGMYVEGNNVNTATSAVFSDVSCSSEDIGTPTSGDLQGVQADLDLISDVAVDIFPNPASGETFVNLGNWQNQSVQLSLFNDLGQQVWNRQLSQVDERRERIDVSDLQSGIYFLRVKGTTDESTHRLVVQNRP